MTPTDDTTAVGEVFWAPVGTPLPTGDDMGEWRPIGRAREMPEIRRFVEICGERFDIEDLHAGMIRCGLTEFTFIACPEPWGRLTRSLWGESKRDRKKRIQQRRTQDRVLSYARRAAQRRAQGITKEKQ